VGVKRKQHSAEFKARVAMAAHVGDVVVDGANLLGDGVNIAARLEGLAEPGGICISGTARDHIGKWASDLPTVAPEVTTETQTALALDDRDP
jgi:class 3 adenylate cyclase